MTRSARRALGIASAFLAGTGLWAADGAAHPYGANPALTPVQFEMRPVHAPLELVTAGVARCAVAWDHTVPKQKLVRRRSIRRGVALLQKALRECAGLEIPVVDANAPEGELKTHDFLILVGKSKLTDQLGMKPLGLPREGFEVRTFSGGVAIAGNDGCLTPDAYEENTSGLRRYNGTENGVLDFVERFLGARFYFPGPGVYWPAVRDLTLRPVRYRDWPRFNRRYPWYMYLYFKGDKWPFEGYENDTSEFIQYWRLAPNSYFGPSHNPVPQPWAKRHPDKLDLIFYRDPTGRLYHNPASHNGNYYDISNLKVADLFLDDCLAYLRTGEPKDIWTGRPNVKYVSFGQCDTLGVLVRNERTEGLLFESQLGTRAEMTDVYCRFFAHLAREAKERLPGQRVATIFYNNYSLPPVKTWDFADNFDATLCIGLPPIAHNPAYLKAWREAFRKWHQALGDRPLAAWTYGGGGGYTGAPSKIFARAMYGVYLGEFIKGLGKYLWHESIVLDCGPNWPTYPSFYCAYHALWNPDFDAHAAIREHWPLLYGPEAGEILRRFHSAFRKCWEEEYVAKLRPDSANLNAIPNMVPLLYSAFNRNVAGELLGLLDEAENAVPPDSVEMTRFRFFAKPWRRALAVAKSYSEFKKPLLGICRLPEGGTVKVDGRLDDGAWQAARPFPFQNANLGPAPQSPVPCRMLWRDEGVYIALGMTGDPLEKKGNLWGSDNFEIFLSPGMNATHYSQIAVSAAGDEWTAFKRLKPFPIKLDGHWDCQGLKQAIGRSENGWTLELFVPFTGLGTKPPSPYDCWQGNVIANRSAAPKEYAGLSITMGNNHDTMFYATFKFLGQGD